MLSLVVTHFRLDVSILRLSSERVYSSPSARALHTSGAMGRFKMQVAIFKYGHENVEKVFLERLC